jgi:hypothetical protein
MEGSLLGLSTWGMGYDGLLGGKVDIVELHKNQ